MATAYAIGASSRARRAISESIALTFRAGSSPASIAIAMSVAEVAMNGVLSSGVTVNSRLVRTFVVRTRTRPSGTCQ